MTAPDTVPALDPRVHAFDPTTRTAEDALRGQLEGTWHFVQPAPAYAAARLSVRAQPHADAEQVTEALPGQRVETLRQQDGWTWLRTAHDGYLGWTPTPGLVPHLPAGAGLSVTALRAHAFAGPKVSRAVLAELSLGSVVVRGAGDIVTENHRRWVPVQLPGAQEAWVQEVTLAPISEPDPAALALRFLDAPYVWGGRTAWGVDCSGLTQAVYAAFGWSLPRDADQQRDALSPVQHPARGDLAFFPGHVGLMLDDRRLVHANATHMRVTVETLGEGEYGGRLQDSLTGFGRWQ